MKQDNNLFTKVFKEIKNIISLQVPISTKITLPYGFLSLIVALGGAYLITQVIISSIEKRFDNTLAETKEIAADLVVIEENRLLENLRLVAYLDGIDQMIVEGNSEELRETILPVVFNTGDDAVVLLSDQGVTELLMIRDLQSGIPDYDFEQGGSEFSEFDFVQKVLNGTVDVEGDKFAGVVPYNGVTYIFVAGPAKDLEGTLTGIILVGKAIDGLLRDIRAQTLSQVTIYNLNGSVLATTLLDPPSIEDEFVAQVRNDQDDLTYNREFVIGDIGYKENLSMWEIRNRTDYGILGIASQTKYLAETAATTRENIFILVALTLFLIFLVGISIARAITKPIHTLRDAALEVSSGNLDVHVDPIGDDEISLLTNTFNTMVTNLNASNREIVIAYDKTLEGWTKALELRDKETEGHTKRVTELTLKLAEAYGIEGPELENIRRGAMLHDIGKVGVSDTILHKPGKLTDEEFDEIKKHPGYAYQMLSEISFLQGAMDIPYCHHEKWDGSGYPQGLAGEKIPIAARMFALADVWDAISSDRVYRKAIPFDKCVQIIKEGSGTHFDPRFVKLFFQVLEIEEEINEVPT
jgi:putative nucleotidyltransferase with HDIG domain